MKSILINYVLTTVVFLIIDLAWLGLIAKNLYQKYLGSLLSDKVNWTAAIIFYRWKKILLPMLCYLELYLVSLPTQRTI